MSARSKKKVEQVDNGYSVYSDRVRGINYPVPGKPFGVGDVVGGVYEVRASYEDGRFYFVNNVSTGVGEYILFDKLQDRVVSVNPHSVFKRAGYFLQSQSTCIADVYSKVFHFGLDLNPVYQRGLVWSLEQKQSFIAACFDEMKSLGILTYHHNGYGLKEPMYTVVDGKQRITALVEFRMGNFSVELGGKPYFYFELSDYDISMFEDRMLPLQFIRDLSIKQQVDLFLLLNDTGVPVDRVHLDKLKEDLRGGVFGE